ncbi:MAG: Hint domain-containing protein [Candidatus Nanopelagicales bacterium]
MGVFVRSPKAPTSGAGAVVGSAVTIRTRRAQPAAYGAIRTLQASARRLDKKELTKLSEGARPYREWQRDAWVGYDRIGEVHYGFNLVASTFSRIRVYGAIITDPDEPPSTLSQADKDIDKHTADVVNEVMAALVGTDFSGFAKMYALNMSVPGECLLLELPDKSGTGSGRWVIRSTDEVRVESTKIRLIPRTDLSGQESLENTLSELKNDQWTPEVNIGRIWRQHPRFSDEPDSSMRAISDSVEELLLVSRMIRTTTRARLNAGLLFIPDTVSVLGGASSAEEPAVDLNGDPVTEVAADDVNSFLSDLIDTIIQPIEDESAASAVVPTVLVGPGEAGTQIKHITLDRKTDSWLADRADRALERILQGIDVPKEIVTGLADVKYCVTPDTEIYTKRGWMTYDELTTDDMIYTLDPETGHGVWSSVQEINVFSYDSEVDGKLVSVETSSHSSLTTPNHQWFVLKNGKPVFTESHKFTSTDRIPVSAVAVGLPPRTHGSYRDEFAELVGWYVTEGNFLPAHPRRRSLPQAAIAQSETANPLKVYRIRRTLTALFGTERADFSSDESTPAWRSYTYNGMTTFQMNNAAAQPLFDVAPGEGKNISLDFIHSLSFEQLKLFAEAAMEGDGSYFGEHKGSSGGGLHPGVFWQKSETIFAAVEAALILLGVPITLYTSAKLGYGLRLKKRAVVSPRRRPDDVKEQDYIGTVWCPTTETGTWLARRNGTVYFTGNSNAVQITEDMYKSNIEPLALMFVDALTDIYLRPILRARGISDEDVERICVWYDPSEIVTKPNQADEATTGYENFLLSGEAWRKAHGFSETEKPNERELAVQLLLSKGQLTEDMVTALLNVALPVIVGKQRENNLADRTTPFPDSASQILNGEAEAETATNEGAPA